eukprot:PhF_6_TR34143/c0_g1_i2/m.49874
MDPEDRILEAEHIQSELEGLLPSLTVHPRQCTRLTKRLAAITRTLRYMKQVPRPRLLAVLRSAKRMFQTFSLPVDSLRTIVILSFNASAKFDALYEAINCVWQLHSTHAWPKEDREDATADAEGAIQLFQSFASENPEVLPIAHILSSQEKAMEYFGCKGAFIDFMLLQGSPMYAVETSHEPCRFVAGMTLFRSPVLLVEVPADSMEMGFAEAFGEDAPVRTKWFHPNLLHTLGCVCARMTDDETSPMV